MPIVIDRKRFNAYFNRIFYPVLFLSIIIILFLLRHVLRAFIVMILFILANVLIGRIRRVIPMPIEIEVVTLGTVVCTMLYGFGAGVFVAVFSAIIGAVIAKRISPYTLVMVVGYIIVATIATAFNPADVVKAGIILTIVNNLFIFCIFQFAFRYSVLRNIAYGLSNVILNILIFKYLAEGIVKFLV